MSTPTTIKPPVIVRTASGRMARCVLEAYDEAETLYLIEHHGKIVTECFLKVYKPSIAFFFFSRAASNILVRFSFLLVKRKKLFF